MGFYSCTVPSFEQMTLTRFLAEGYFEKHLNRMKKHYRAVRGALLDALAQPPCAGCFRVHDAGAGLHFVLEVPGAPEPERLRALLRQTGLHAALLADFYAGAPEPEAARCIVLDYADAEPEALQGALRRLAAEITGR